VRGKERCSMDRRQCPLWVDAVEKGLVILVEL
jgi:hypothetical protein